MELYSTKSDIEEAKNSMFWKDIRRELKAWKKGFAIEQDNIVNDAETENPSTGSILLHMGDLNGRKKAIDYLLGLPDIFLQLLEEKKEEKKDGTGRERTD